jgi:hypothetical protein
MSLEFWELLSYIVTVIGLPVAIAVFLLQQRKERINEELMVYESLSDGYQKFLKVALEHADLHLFSKAKTPALTVDQQDRMIVIFTMLMSLFERAFIMIYQEGVDYSEQRHWRSWHDFMRDWCAREDFRDVLDLLLVGEDTEFCLYIRNLAAQTAVQNA